MSHLFFAREPVDLPGEAWSVPGRDGAYAIELGDEVVYLAEDGDG